MNKLEKINKLVEKIKIYGSRIPDICENVDINVRNNCIEDTIEDGNIFVRLVIDKTYIRFLIDENGEFFIETSLNTFESLDELEFWKTMYIERNH